MKNFFKLLYRKLQKKLRIVNLSDFEYILNETSEKLSNMNFQIENLYSILSIIKNESSIIKNDNYRVERDLFQCFKNSQYKNYENNKYLNQMLYNQELEMNRLKGFYRENFNPKVSIIIPAYNASNYLKEAIDSALNQLYKNIEIIVVNDGSTDNGLTEKIAKSYGNKIRYYKKENGGVSSALNYGIRKMDGDYFAWLSHDDLYYPDNISEHINYLKNSKQDNVITFTNFNIIDENSNVLLEDTISANMYCFDYKTNQIKPEYSLLQGEINGGSVLIPKQAFYEFGFFDENLRIAQERNMWSRLMPKYTFHNIPLETTSIRVHLKQVTNTNINVIKESNEQKLEIIKKLSPEIKSKLEHTEHDFYVTMKNFYHLHNLDFLQQQMDEYITKKDVV